MINQEELAICRRRGHLARAHELGWLECEACGMWVREKRTILEREDEPPEDELHPSLLTKRHMTDLERRIKERERGTKDT